MLGSPNISSYYGLTNVVPQGMATNQTYQTLEDLVRAKTMNFDMTDSYLIECLNQNVSNIYSKLKDRKRYRQTARLSLMGSSNPYTVDLTILNPFPSKINNLVYLGYDRTNGIELNPVDAVQAEQLSTTNGNSVYYVPSGDSILVWLGSNLTVVQRSSVYMLYERQPDISVDTTNDSSKYPDIPEEYIDELARMTMKDEFRWQ